MKKRLAMAALVALGVMAPWEIAAQSTAPEMGKHSTSGEVTRVDAKKGWMHVKTADGTMIVHFPPSELQSVRKGDSITLHLALKSGPGAPKQ